MTHLGLRAYAARGRVPLLAAGPPDREEQRVVRRRLGNGSQKEIKPIGGAGLDRPLSHED